MEITARDIVEAFVEEDITPCWGSYGDNKKTGCAVTALTLFKVGRVKRGDTPDYVEAKNRIGRGDYGRIILGFEDSLRTHRGQAVLAEWEEKQYPAYQAGLDAGIALLKADKDPRVALMELDIQAVKKEAKELAVV